MAVSTPMFFLYNASNVFFLTPQIQLKDGINPKPYLKLRKRDESMRKRTIKINVFLNEDEKKIFDEKAKKSGLNKSEFFRKIILEYQLSEKPDERFYEFLHQLRGMATNLNQMAKIYNENYGYVNTSKYKTMLDEIESFILGLNEVYVLPKKIGDTNGNNKSMEI